MIDSDHHPGGLLREIIDHADHDLEQDLLDIRLRMSYSRDDLGVSCQPLSVAQRMISTRETVTSNRCESQPDIGVSICELSLQPRS